MSVRHIVCLRFNEGTTAEQVAELDAALRRLPDLIPGLVDFRVGADVGLAEDNADFGISADFATLADYLVYRDHPEHQQIIVGLVRPITASRTAVQFGT